MPFNKIGSKGITDGSIATAEFADGIVTSAKLQSGAVTNDKLTNTTVSVSGTSITLGSSATFNNKFVNWQSVIVADGSTGTTGVSGRGYFINTTSAAHTFTLPVSATRGDNISIKDYAGTFATNNLTIARNGHNIQGVANNSLITTNRASVVLVYVDVTRGWEFVEESNVATLGQALFTSATGGTITTSGNFKIHSFTGDGCFVVSSVGNPAGSIAVDYLVVAGGGGSTGDRGGGAGAGGYRTTFPSPGCNAGSFPISVTTYPITVGGGGAGKSGEGKGTSGTNSVFSTITSAGGGAGGTHSSPGNTASSGGSGGGAGGTNGGGGVPGSGNTPPVSPPQGNPGGAGATDSATFTTGGGGGGASAVGSNAVTSTAGAGGAGTDVSSIFGPGLPNSGVYAGGGGGGGYGGGAPGTGGTGGTGGGGPSSFPGTANTGGGGGAWNGSNPSSGSGGSGIVIIRAPGAAGLSASPGTNTVTTLPAPAGGCKVATFTVSGTLTT